MNSYLRLADKYERLSHVALKEKRIVLTRSSVRHLWKYRTKQHLDANDNRRHILSTFSKRKPLDGYSTEGTFLSDDETPVKVCLVDWMICETRRMTEAHLVTSAEELH